MNRLIHLLLPNRLRNALFRCAVRGMLSYHEAAIRQGDLARANVCRAYLRKHLGGIAKQGVEFTTLVRARLEAAVPKSRKK